MNIPELTHQNFSLLSSELLDYLDKEGEVVTYAKDSLVLDYGLETDFMPIILSGTARVMRLDDEDPSKELLLYFLGAGEICPCAAFSSLPNGVMAITVESETVCRILHLPLEKLAYIAGNFPEWRMFELSSFKQRFEELLSLVDHAVFKQLGSRLLAYIEKRCLLNGRQGVPLSKVKMASELGTSREVVSRLLKNLELEGVITQDKSGVHLTAR